MEFENHILDIEQLPKVEEMDFKSLHADYLQVSILSGLVQWIIILAILITGLSFWGFLFDLKIFLLSLGAWVLLMGISLLLRWLGFKHKSYAIREKDVHYKSGLLWRSETSIPFHRVQHAEVSQGLIERMFKLGRLKVFTAGGESSDLVIPGLQPDQAARLKAYVLKKSGLEEQEENADKSKVSNAVEMPEESSVHALRHLEEDHLEPIEPSIHPKKEEENNG